MSNKSKRKRNKVVRYKVVTWGSLKGFSGTFTPITPISMTVRLNSDSEESAGSEDTESIGQ